MNLCITFIIANIFLPHPTQRIVSKLLTTFLDRNNSEDVLDVLCNLLAISGEDREKIGSYHKRKDSSSGHGLISSWWGGSSSSGLVTPKPPQPISMKNEDSLSNAWVDFLLKELQDDTNKQPKPRSLAARREGEAKLPRIEISSPPHQR